MEERLLEANKEPSDEGGAVAKGFCYPLGPTGAHRRDKRIGHEPIDKETVSVDDG